MDIVKGSLEDISRPAFIPRSRSGTRVSSATLAEKPKLNSTAGSLKVLTPEPTLSKVHPNLSENSWSSVDSSFSLSCNDLDGSSESDFPVLRGNGQDRKATPPLQPSETRETGQDKRRSQSLQASENTEHGHGRKATPPLQPSETRETGQDKRRSQSLQPSENTGRKATPPLQPSETRETGQDKKRTQSLQPSENTEHGHGRKATPPLQPSETRETGQDKKRTQSLQPAENTGRKATPPLQPSETRETGQDKRRTQSLHPSEIRETDQDTIIISNQQQSQMENKLKQTWNCKEGSDLDEHEESDEENKDPQLADAIRKMKTLDTILAKKQAREREVKCLGQQMRKKLWEELQSATCPEVLQTHEETLNTRKFLALTPQMLDISDTHCVDEDETFTPVFHTQIPPEEDEMQEDHNSLGIKHRCESSELPNHSDEMPHAPRKRNKRVDFIKRNIELARDAGNQIVLMDDEKQRIEDLLRDMEDGTGTEEDVSGWIVPGEGYTPEPDEHQQLAKIDAKLQAVLSAEDFASIHSSCSSIHKQSYQESLTFMNGNLEMGLLESTEEVLPGERALRLTKEERLQQARLKEIDQQLENLERGSSCESLPSLSEEQLKTLLDECYCRQSSVSSSSFLPINDASSPSFRAAGSPRLSPTVLAKLLQDVQDCQTDSAIGKRELDAISTCDIKGSKVVGEDASVSTDGRCSSGTLTAATAEMLDENEYSDQQYMDNTDVGYFMSRALSLTKLKKPSFLNEAFYCMDITNEVWREADIPDMPEETGRDGLQVEDLTRD